MASTPIEICNNALVEIGANTISDFTETSSEAKICNLKYNITRQSLLSAHPWTFAIRRETLVEVAEAPEFGWGHQFQLPSDLLRLLRVEGSLDHRKEGRRILTNDLSCSIKYIFDNEDVTTWSVSFIDLLAARLAFEMAYAITRIGSVRDRQFDIYQEKYAVARAHNSSESYHEPVGQGFPNLIGVRF